MKKKWNNNNNFNNNNQNYKLLINKFVIYKIHHLLILKIVIEIDHQIKIYLLIY